jgi:hypothetical protein
VTGIKTILDNKYSTKKINSRRIVPEILMQIQVQVGIATQINDNAPSMIRTIRCPALRPDIKCLEKKG